MKRRNKVIIGAGVGLGLIGAGAMIKLNKLEIPACAGLERSKEDMIMTEKEMDEQLKAYADIFKPTEDLSPIEKEKISDSIKGMSESELRVVLKNIPVGLMFDEVMARLAMYDQFAMHIQDAMKCLPK